MTVASETNRSGPYNGNGVTTVFDYEFRIISQAHLLVIKTVTATGVETTLTLDADYTASGVGASGGGQITTLVAPAAGETITILRKVPFVQETDLENQGAYYAETLETVADLSVMRDQELQEQVNRAIQIPISSDPAELDDLVANIIRLKDSVDEIDVVAGIADDVTAVADNTANINIVAGLSDEILAVPAQVAAAEAARDAAEGAAETVVVARYNSKAGVEAATVNVAVQSIEVTGYFAAGDGGKAIFKRVGAEPAAGNGKIQSLDGAWWQLSEGQNTTADMLGAVGDEITNDNTAVRNAIALRAAASKRYLVNTINSVSNVVVDERIVDNGAANNPAISIGNNTEFYRFSGRAESLDGQAVNDSSSAASKIIFGYADLKAASYCILSDDASDTNLKDVIITSSFMYSNRADVIALNHFNANAQNFLMHGNIMETGNGSAFPGSGFGVSVAGTKGWLLADTIIKYTRSEAIHIEDEQREGQISNVTVRETIDHGLYISRSAESGGQGPSEGINVSNLVVKHNIAHPSHPTGTKAGFYGVYVLATEHGSAPACNFSNIRAHGFEYGFNIGGGSAVEVCSIQNGYAKDCDFAINLTAGAIVRGEILATDCPTLVRASNNSELESIITNTVPTGLLDYVGTTINHGVTIRHLQFQKLLTLTDAGAQVIDLMDMPTRLLARISLRLNNNNHAFHTSLMVSFDGTTFSIIPNTSVPSHIGTISAVTLINNAGKLALSLTCTTIVTAKRLVVDITGDTYSTKDLLAY
ncbi:hypothetical protein SAMN05428953_12646 [Mesorhizobium muleiense]|uniref:Right handed beta helix region n=2 Tax=Mesorhizobium muleiense TaxID=1004279 RepID=A0A1G9H3I7_9HYPH|nr:hypothetical protein SAMN05428953_12646 [Mesorhizobium muleiense]